MWMKNNGRHDIIMNKLMSRNMNTKQNKENTMSILKEATELYNGLRKLQNMTEAFENWKVYREKVSQYILQNTQQGTTIAIVGAGRCNDIDLTLFSKHFSEMSLIDIDDMGMRDAIKKYDIDATCKVDIVVRDFVGIQDKDYIEFANIMCKDMKKYKSFFSPMVTGPKMIEKLNEVYSKISEYELDLGEKNYDYVVVLGVHSQLNSMFEWMWRSMISALGKNDFTVRERVSQENLNIINKFDATVYKMARRGLFIGCEREIIGIPMPFPAAQAAWSVQTPVPPVL